MARNCGVALECREFCPDAELEQNPHIGNDGLLTGAVGQINGTTYSGYNINRVGIGTGVDSLGAPRQVEFGLRITF
jgi:hypothetical protein